jgi:hypothetical protein
MADPSMIDGALIALGAFVAGQWLPRPHRRRGALPSARPPQPVCGCEHHVSFHDPKSGECHAMMKVPSSMSRDSYHKPCTCRQYSGPTVLPEYFVPEISSE